MNPYDVLGVAPSATDDEVKRAYRTLCKKYHPDLHIGKPDAVQAEKQFMQVQQAYETIMKQRQGGAAAGDDPFGGFGGYGTGAYGAGAYGAGGYGSGGSAYQTGGNPQNARMQAAVNYINVGHYQEALGVLQGIDERTGQWYFLSAMAHWGLGEQMTAIEHARIACRMEPGNMQYRQMLSQMEGGGQFYQQAGQGYGRPQAGGGDWCMQMMLCNLLCNCCGGVPCVPCC